MPSPENIRHCKLCRELSPEDVKWIEAQAAMHHGYKRIGEKLGWRKQKVSVYWHFHKSNCMRTARLRDSALKKCPESFKLSITDEFGFSSTPQIFSALPDAEAEKLGLIEVEILITRQKNKIDCIVDETTGQTEIERRITVEIQTERIDAENTVLEQTRIEAEEKRSIRPQPILKVQDDHLAACAAKSMGKFW